MRLNGCIINKIDKNRTEQRIFNLLASRAPHFGFSSDLLPCKKSKEDEVQEMKKEGIQIPILYGSSLRISWCPCYQMF